MHLSTKVIYCITFTLYMPKNLHRTNRDKTFANIFLMLNKTTKMLPNLLGTISISWTTLPTTWQFVVFPYTKLTLKPVKTSNKNLSFNLALLTLMESVNTSHLNKSFIHVCWHHHSSTNGVAPSAPIYPQPQSLYLLWQKKNWCLECQLTNLYLFTVEIWPLSTCLFQVLISNFNSSWLIDE